MEKVKRKTKQPRNKLQREPDQNTITFYISNSMKHYILDTIQDSLSQSDYVEQCVRNLLKFIKTYESRFLDIKDNARSHGSMMNNLSLEEHRYIYTCIHDYAIFYSRSELIRFALFLERIFELVENERLDNFEFAFNPDVENEEETFIEFKKSLKMLRENYPESPAYKFINEE